MPTYDPAGHPRLSTAAAALSPEALAAYADEAEALFGIAGTGYTDQDAADLTTAVARQVNLAVKLDAHGGGAVASESKGDQSVTFAKGQDGAVVQIDATAQRIVDRVKASGALADGAIELPPASSTTEHTFSW